MPDDGHNGQMETRRLQLLTELSRLGSMRAVADVLDAMLQRFENPAVSRDDLLATLDASNCRAFATALGNAWGLASSGV